MEQAQIESEIYYGPAVMVMADGSRWTTECSVTSYSDIRQTPFGPVDFGKMFIGPSRLIKIEETK